MPAMTMMVWAVLSLVLVGCVISAPLTWLLARVGLRMNTLDSAGSKGHIKTELRRVPNIGGIAIFIAIFAPLALGWLVLSFMSDAALGERLAQAGYDALTSNELIARLRGDSLPTLIALLGCLLALHLTGIVDDRKSLGPWTKLAVQIGAAAVLAIFFNVRLLELLGFWPSVLVTVGWIVVITNAINFLDNMDGLAGGVSAIAATFFLAATLINQQWFIAAALALLVGGLIGFLFFNFPPAKIFMGDGGSLVVGFLLAVLTARTTFFDEAAGGGALGGGWYGVFMPIVVLAIPLYDLVTVTAIRLKQGKSPFVGDQQHFSHRLVQRGLSKRGAVVLIWCFTAITGIAGVSLGRLEGWQAMLVGVQTILIWVMLGILEHTSRKSVRGE